MSGGGARVWSCEAFEDRIQNNKQKDRDDKERQQGQVD